MPVFWYYCCNCKKPFSRVVTQFNASKSCSYCHTDNTLFLGKDMSGVKI